MSSSSRSLRVCRANAERFALPLEEWLARGWTVDCAACLAQCGDCEAGPFAELDGEFVFVDNVPDLAARIAAVAPVST